VAEPVFEPLLEHGVRAPIDGNACDAKSEGGWYCCLPRDHDRNHIATTSDYGLLYQWPPELETGLPKSRDTS
jgi:hypothetical protein